jgi:hypothetical protein
MWELYERDYGADRSLAGILSHPRQLAKDLARNAGRLVALAQGAVTCTTAGCLDVAPGRWLLCLLLAFGTAALLVRRDWKGFWQAAFRERGWAWLSLLCLLPLVAPFLVMLPFPVYTLVLTPLLYGWVLLAGYAIGREVLVHRREVFLAAVILFLAWVPSRGRLVARQEAEPQPLRREIEFFASLPAGEAPLTLVGEWGFVVCPYLSAMGRDCEARWPDEGETFQTLAGAGVLPGDYLLFDSRQQWRLELDPDLAAVVWGRDPRWQEVFRAGTRVVYRFAE